jgi:hypothetical protein
MRAEAQRSVGRSVRGQRIEQVADGRIRQGAGDVGQGHHPDQGVAVDHRKPAHLVRGHGLEDLPGVVVGADGDGLALGQFTGQARLGLLARGQDLQRRALDGRRPDLVKPVLPPVGCAFLAKVRHSAFFGTSLEYLLHRQEIQTLVLAGQVTEQCVGST